MIVVPRYRRHESHGEQQSSFSCTPTECAKKPDTAEMPENDWPVMRRVTQTFEPVERPSGQENEAHGYKAGCEPNGSPGRMVGERGQSKIRLHGRKPPEPWQQRT